MPEPLITILRTTDDPKSVTLDLRTGTATHPAIRFQWNTGSALAGELFTAALRKFVGDAIEAARREEYQAGYKAGKRDAKSRRPSTACEWFRRVL